MMKNLRIEDLEKSFVVVNKAKQGKGQVTLCFKCETSASPKTRKMVKRPHQYLLRKYCVMCQTGSHPMNCTFQWADGTPISEPLDLFLLESVIGPTSVVV